jgi:antitoxin (DNA-binding transcriptional repressor) of toxin-antitoxin stability system
MRDTIEDARGSGQKSTPVLLSAEKKRYLDGVATIHISAAEAARDFTALLARVRAGAEVMIEDGPLTVAVLHTAAPQRRSIEECIALLPEDSPATIDDDFARNVAEAVAERTYSHLTTKRPLRVRNTKFTANTLRIRRPATPDQEVRLISQLLIKPRINPTPTRLVHLKIVEQRILRLRIIRRNSAVVRSVAPRRIRHTPKLRLICLPIHQRDFSALTRSNRSER